MKYDNQGSGCDGDCHSCGVSGGHLDQPDGPLSGWRFVGAAVCYFLMPLMLAITGGVMGRSYETWIQWIYSAAGLAVGMLIAVIFAKIVGRRYGVTS